MLIIVYRCCRRLSDIHKWIQKDNNELGFLDRGICENLKLPDGRLWGETRKSSGRINVQEADNQTAKFPRIYFSLHQLKFKWWNRNKDGGISGGLLLENIADLCYVDLNKSQN